MKNIFTVDLEDWYHSNFFGNPPKNKNSHVEKPTEKLLKILHSHHSTATFFTLGEIAQKHPNLIKEIAKQGHEVASHGCHHFQVCTMTQNQFDTDLKESIMIIESLTKKKVLGFRAPSWSVSQQATPWFWSVLKKNNLQYSSSLFPFKTFLYGDQKAKQNSHFINNILEIPPSTLPILRLPFSGGCYLRLLPFPIIYLSSKLLNLQKQPVNFYIHPREIDPFQPRLKLPPKENLIHYYGIFQTENKLKKILSSFSCQSIKKYYKL